MGPHVVVKSHRIEAHRLLKETEINDLRVRGTGELTQFVSPLSVGLPDVA